MRGIGIIIWNSLLHDSILMVVICFWFTIMVGSWP